jgi:hypothetical protein
MTAGTGGQTSVFDWKSAFVGLFVGIILALVFKVQLVLRRPTETALPDMNDDAITSTKSRIEEFNHIC